jgi:hypothetical protein
MNDDELLPFEKHLTTHTEEDVFILYLQQKIELKEMSEKLQERFKRLQQCRDYTKQYLTRTKVVPMMMTDFGISEAQAYRDYNSTVKVFNLAIDNDGRDFYVDILLGNINETRTLARIAKDFKTMEKSDKNFLLAIDKFFGNNLAKIYDEIQMPVLITKYIPNPNLPANWREQVAKIIARKKDKEIDITDAEIVEEPDGPTD